MADQVADLPPSINDNLRFILIGSYSEISDQAKAQIKWQIYPPRKWQFEIHTDRFLPREAQADEVPDLPARK